MEYPSNVISTREMLVVEDARSVQHEVRDARRRGQAIGVVPTMGALHAGHLSLIQTACEECDFVIVTIFVNPTQFGPDEDFDRYPRTLEADLAECRRLGVDLIFSPPTRTMYPEDFCTFVEVEGLSDVLEGKYRPGHFRGVATVVLKLLNIVQPDMAYFGRKDYQQQTLIRTMCRDLDLPVDIRICPTVREPDGLALSSRNRYLTPPERRTALSLSMCLNETKDRLLSGETDVKSICSEMRNRLQSLKDVRLDYFTVAHAETMKELNQPHSVMIALVAAYVGQTRLIDNIPIRL